MARLSNFSTPSIPSNPNNSNKRKGEEYVVDSTNILASSVDGWDDCHQMIQSMMQMCDLPNTALEKHLQTISTEANRFDNEHETYMTIEVAPLKQKLYDLLQSEKSRIEKEIEENNVLQTKIQILEHDKEIAEIELEKLKQQETELLAEMKALKTQLSNEINDMESIQDTCKLRVPRLRHQLSLYGNLSRIKWNFDMDTNTKSKSTTNKEGILNGQISIPSLQTIKRFEIDPTEYSKYEIAQMLWSYIEEGIKKETNGVMVASQNEQNITNIDDGAAA